MFKRFKPNLGYRKYTIYIPSDTPEGVDEAFIHDGLYDEIWDYYGDVNIQVVREDDIGS